MSRRGGKPAQNKTENVGASVGEERVEGGDESEERGEQAEKYADKCCFVGDLQKHA